MGSSVLSDAQVSAFHRDGYLIVNELIPEQISSAAHEAMWRLLGISRDNPESWKDASTNHTSYDAPDLVACYTPEFIQAAGQLGGDDLATYRPPQRAYIINLFPQVGPWKWPNPHIDHAIKAHAHKTFPRAFRIATMAYVSDVESQGGATVVWPGGHRIVESLARRDPERFEYMWALGAEVPKLDLGCGVEVIARRGSVLFYHYLCPHAGGMNVLSTPRFAMNMKW